MTIRGEKGEVLGAGETGLVYMTSPGGRFKYHQDPDKTAAAWQGDTYTLGDVGHLDSDGYLFLTDRAADVVIRGGVNIYPAEVDLDDASSLVFYLHRTFYLVNQPRNDEMHIPGGKDIAVSEDAILRHWGDPQSIYLIIKQERVPHWQQLLTDRFHIYHQVATSGAHVVLTNQL